MRNLLLILFTTFALVNLSIADEKEDEEDIGEVEVELVSEVEGVEIGTWFNVAVKFDIEDEWHIYWKNPGDSGLPTEIKWDIPKGIKKVGEMMWQMPEKKESEDMADYIYEGELVLIQQFQAIDTKPGENYELNADVSWLICKEKCVPQKTSVSIEIAGADDNYWSEDRDMILSAKQEMPNPKPLYYIEAEEDEDNIILHGKKPLTHKFTKLTIFPISQSVLSNTGEQKVTINSQDFKVVIPKSEYFSDAPESFKIMVSAPEGFDSPENKAFETEVKFINNN